jgi:hypothetical protein
MFQVYAADFKQRFNFILNQRLPGDRLNKLTMIGTSCNTGFILNGNEISSTTLRANPPHKTENKFAK